MKKLVNSINRKLDRIGKRRRRKSGAAKPRSGEIMQLASSEEHSA